MTIKFLNITQKTEKINTFYSLYKKYFPIQERDTLRNIKKLAHNSLSVPNWDYNIIELIDQEKEVGGIIYSWFSDINVMIIEFVFITENYRHHRIAQRLINRLKTKIPDVNILVEVEKNGSAKKFWEKMGFSTLRYRYIQPSINSNQKPFDGLILMSNKPIKNIKEILNNYYWKYSFPSSINICPPICGNLNDSF